MKHYRMSRLLFLLVALMAFGCGQNTSQETTTSEETEFSADSISESTLDEQEYEAARFREDSVAYAQLDMYDGTYYIVTESEGVNASISLKYNGDRTFEYEWTFTVSNAEAHCQAARKGTFTMDRTRHGMDGEEECLVHFNFDDELEGYYRISIDFADQSQCRGLDGNCNFFGIYEKPAE
jgi:hypothetical protein